MAVKLAFNRVEQFSDGNGNPYVGAKLFTYVAGSVGTKQTTYTESTGTTPNTNPIVLDANGQLPQPVWLTTGAAYKFVLAPSTDTDPPGSPFWTLDNITGINDSSSSQSEWISSGFTPTFVSATQFTVSGDQTTAFAKSRRIKATVTAGTVYGTVTASSFGASITTVTVQCDSGTTLDSGISAISYGIVAGANPSISPDMIYRKGSSVGSSATTDIWSASGDFLHVTGTTTITSFGTAPYAGARREIIFDSALTLTHNGTSLQCPGGESINVGVGDRAVIRADTTSNMIVTDYVRADGSPLFIAGKNYLINGSFALAQRAMPTADNSYCLDRWRLLLGAANAATVTQDTADVPTGAKYACKLVVGSGTNNKFGIFQPIEGVNIYDLRGQTVSIRVPLKATAGLTDGAGKIRVGIMQWTGTEDSISATPISSWGSEGTNPTLIASWAFANTPTALSVTTSWADYVVENITISSSAVNLGVLIWSDDKANTQTTDILRIGGYVTMIKGSNCLGAVVAPITREILDCQRYYAKTFPLGTAPSQGATQNGAFAISGQAGGVNSGGDWQFPVLMRAAPTVTTYNPVSSNANWRDIDNAADRTRTIGTSNPSARSAFILASTTANGQTTIQITADAEL